MNLLKNKVALITGSASGLGKTAAERYAAWGADTVLNHSRDTAFVFVRQRSALAGEWRTNQ